MINKDGMNASRRSFMKKAGAVSMVGVGAPLALNLAAMAEASAAGANDYKALVCIFFNGGNDYANTVAPFDLDSHTKYFGYRPNFAHTRAALTPTLLVPTVTPVDRNGFNREYALAPGLASLFPLFNTGKLGVILNVGTLVQPTTKAQAKARSVPLPPKLYSHNDQQSVWQSSMPEGATTGWGGRMGDMFEATHGDSTFTCVNLASNVVYMSGNQAVPYQVSTNGSSPVNGVKNALFGSNAARDVMRTLVTQTSTHLLEKEYNVVSKRAIDANETLTAALAAKTLTTPFPANNNLGNQLKMVARMISVAGDLGVKRQVFFVQMGGFDTHDGMLVDHPVLMTRVGEAMAAFYNATVELNVAAEVTAFTASDFGRTLSGNENGSDHGWGSMHFVMGGAVNGQRFYGTPPIVAADGPDDVGQGRLVPTTSVEQLACTLGKWMGISDSALLDILPNLSNYNVGDRNLGFV